jgi:hypothetical protein
MYSDVAATSVVQSINPAASTSAPDYLHTGDSYIKGEHANVYTTVRVAQEICNSHQLQGLRFRT